MDCFLGGAACFQRVRVYRCALKQNDGAQIHRLLIRWAAYSRYQILNDISLLKCLSCDGPNPNLFLDYKVKSAMVVRTGAGISSLFAFM